LPFVDSRRLTGSNLFFASTGAVLDAVGVSVDDALIDAWRARVERARATLRWDERQSAARRHAGGVLLAISAPSDQLWLATEINEWALCAALAEREPATQIALEAALAAAAAAAAEEGPPALSPAPVIDETAAFARFQRLASSEQRPALRALLAAAEERRLPSVVDESQLTLGAGAGGRSFPLEALPPVDGVRWDELRAVPTAIVTGSNGKTTTVRLLAACARAHGWRTGYNCTDGVFLDDEVLASGDYSGPAGARMVMRDRRTEAAILEIARGGILRRGIAISRAAAAVVTNISADHFGEYGIDDLAGLADVKLSVAAVVGQTGLLVLNAGDPQLRAKAAELEARFGHRPRLGWFGLDDRTWLPGYRAQGASTCGARDGRLCLHIRGEAHDLGPIDAMPLSMASLASYNIANLAGAALAASALGIPAATIAAVFAHFGKSPRDNPGRLMRFEFNGARVLIDYAHNPDGLRGFLSVASQLRGNGRLGLLLGTAGNRKDADIADLARVAAEFHPDLIVIKEDEAHLRGRAPGEIPAILRGALLRAGMPEAALPVCDTEFEAAHYALGWARPGDVLAMPLHAPDARERVVAELKKT
jgi:cyanophycin synthetase